MKRAGVIVLGLAALALLALGGWIGGELHYRNCLASVGLRYPTALAQASGKPSDNPYDSYTPAAFAFYPNKRVRDHALSSCSRLP